MAAHRTFCQRTNHAIDAGKNRLEPICCRPSRKAVRRRAVEGVLASAHPAFEIAPGVILEIPPPEWGHGEFLVYLPERNWMVRRNYVDHWYVDIGITKPFRDNVRGWTDLWLDVTAPEPASHYHLRDADEFAAALRDGSISVENAATAMESLNALVKTIRDGAFPVPEVRLAEAFYASYR
jgi:hypothetical protein